MDSLPINWFDLVVVAVLIFGLRRGRKQGMSEELLSLLKWLALVFGCAFAYQPLGGQIAKSSVFNLLAGYLMAYCAAALIIATIFALIKKSLGGKLLGSDVFGRSEFYLGMAAGGVKYACILIAGLALLNAREYSKNEIRADIAYQHENYGSDFFPKLYTVQSSVFQKSLCGSLVKQHLGILLIKPTEPEKKEIKRKEFAL